MALDTFITGLGNLWQTATNWTGGVPTSTSDVVIPAASAPLTVLSSATATANTITVAAGSELEVTGNSTFNDLNASSPSGTFGFVDVVTADFVIGNGIFNNSSTFQLDSTTPSQSRLLIGGNVTFDGAGHINFTVSGTGGAGSNQITSQSGIATLTDIDNKIFGSGSILDINFINKTTVETGVSGTLIIWGDAGGGSFNNQNLLQADEGGTLILGNGADNANIANTGIIELNEAGNGSNTKMEIAGNVAINGAGGGQIVFSGPSSADNTIVSNGSPATLTLNGGELTGVGSIGDANLTLNLKSFLIEETKVQLVVAAASTTIDAGSKMEAASGGEIFIQGPVTNGGIINVLSGGEIFLSNTITNQGSGSIFIGPNGTLSLLGNGNISGIVQFTGSGGTLELSADHHISNSIQGTAIGDSFDLTYETFQSSLQAVWQQAGAAGTLFLEKNGTVLTTVSLQGQYTSADFTVAADANGATIIKDIGGASPAVTFPFTADTQSQVEAVYVAYFGRAGDTGGSNYWGGQLSSGALSITGEAASFSVQAESKGQYPFLVNPLTASTTGTNNALDVFINSVYQNLFGHAADGTDTTGGLGFWRGNILTALATNNPGTVAQELGAFAIQVAFGALGSDVTSLTNKITVADYFTQAVAAAGITTFTAGLNTLAHTAIASVTSTSSTVSAAEASISSYLTAHPAGNSVALMGISDVHAMS